MNVGDVMTCNDFNNQAMINCGGKNLALNCFLTSKMNLRRYGYVGKYKYGVIWKKTKKEIKELLEELK